MSRATRRLLPLLLICSLAAPAFAGSAPAEIQIGRLVTAALGAAQQDCAAHASASGCSEFFDHLKWLTVPGLTSVMIIYRAAGTPFPGGTLAAGSAAAKQWAAVASPLFTVCEAVAGHIHGRGWPQISVYAFGLEKAPSDFFGPVTSAGDAIFLLLGPKYGGGCTRI